MLAKALESAKYRLRVVRVMRGNWEPFFAGTTPYGSYDTIVRGQHPCATVPRAKPSEKIGVANAEPRENNFSAIRFPPWTQCKAISKLMHKHRSIKCEFPLRRCNLSGPHLRSHRPTLHPHLFLKITDTSELRAKKPTYMNGAEWPCSNLSPGIITIRTNARYTPYIIPQHIRVFPACGGL